MHGKLFLPILLVWALCLSTSTRGQAPATTQPQQGAPINAPNPSNSQSGTANSRSGQTARSPNEIIEGVFKREKEQDEIIASYAPIVETYIQTEKSDPLMGTLPKHDLYFLGQADFRGKTMKVHPMTKRTHTGFFMWSFDPAGFLQMAFLDFGEFDKDHYTLTYRGREFLGEVRCHVFDVERAPKTKGPRFRGRIWAEDQDFTIVRMNGDYAPEVRFSLRHFEDEFYLHFDSWRTNVGAGLWLPSDIYAQDLRKLQEREDRGSKRGRICGATDLQRKTARRNWGDCSLNLRTMCKTSQKRMTVRRSSNSADGESCRQKTFLKSSSGSGWRRQKETWKKY